MKKQLLACLTGLLTLSSCTFNVSMSHVSGASTDTMEDAQTNTPTVSPNINIPVTPGSALGLVK